VDLGVALAISAASGAGRDAAAVERLQTLLAGEMAQVNALILERLQSPVTLIPQLASHLIASGGKRLRPLVTLAAAKLCGYQGPHHIALAAAVEFIHTATLLHDDVIDESALRRGQATANMVWGNQASVLVGDFLFSRAFQLMVETDSAEALRILSAASAVIAEGEVLQLTTAHDLETDETGYMSVIAGKTAALFAAAAEMGAVIAGRPAAEREALRSYGADLGIAYQLVDDVLDYTGRRSSLGKNTGDDFREGKITLPVVLAHRRASDEERGFWRRTLVDGIQADGDFKLARRLLERHGALADTIAEARRYAATAEATLARFPANEHRKALIDLAAFAPDRLY
jgi:octaprenyl-diphosphate synthase